MSNNSHHERYFTKLLIGFASITGSIFTILYAAFERSEAGDWYFWGIVASFLMCGGFYFMLSAFVHKIKSDFSRRQKSRDQQKAFTTDAT